MPEIPPFERVLRSDEIDVAEAIEIGRSRDGRAIDGYRFGSGGLRVSLIGGCHADEPVGPMTLRRLAATLASSAPHERWLSELSWWIVPHANPDGEARNRAWSDRIVERTGDGRPATGYDLKSYLRHVERELPGDDVEFGFPEGPDDAGARPENRAVAEFLRVGAPFHLHGSFHGMGFAPGPWFLIERSWADRTVALRDNLRRRVAEMGYSLYDVDRGGEKGFWRIDAGFTSRPDSRAMRQHFEARGDTATAESFRPSSMEFVRSLGGEPFTFVSEMPLFLRPPDGDPRLENLPTRLAGTAARLRLHAWLRDLAAERTSEELGAAAAARGIRAMPLLDQATLQLAFLDEAMRVVAASQPDLLPPFRRETS